MSDWAYSNNPLNTQVIHISGPAVNNDGFYKRWKLQADIVDSMYKWRY